MNFEYSKGVFVISLDNKLLILKSTLGNNWSIPKGHIEKGEVPLEAAIRETHEECNLDLNNINGKFHYAGSCKYMHKDKEIEAFVFKAEEDLSKYTLKCNSNFLYKKKILPEVNKFLWVTKEEAMSKLHEAQVKLLANIEF